MSKPQFEFSDPVLASLHLKVVAAGLEPQPIVPPPSERYFENLVESIVSQQLSVKVADIIFARLKETVGSEFLPSTVIGTSHEDLRAVGLSNAKASYIKNIAEAWESGLVTPAELTTMDEETLIEKLVQIKGVGRWTAEMFLIFTLGKQDVFSVGDYGLKKAISQNYGIDIKSKPAEFLKISSLWTPQRSLASRILWKSLELT